MRHLILAIALCSSLACIAQKNEVRREIERLEQLQCDAIVRQDTNALFRLWAADFTVNSPTNDVVKLDKAKMALRLGLINYSLYEHTVEEIMTFKDVVLTMGSEKIIPRAGAPMEGQTVFRRYTQLWARRNGTWKLVARHAHIIK